MKYIVPVTVVERREVVVEAETKAQAIAKARRGDWEECFDPFTVTIRAMGPVEEFDEAPSRRELLPMAERRMRPASTREDAGSNPARQSTPWMVDVIVEVIVRRCAQKPQR
jgi:hypothetical protein